MRHTLNAIAAASAAEACRLTQQSRSSDYVYSTARLMSHARTKESLSIWSRGSAWQTVCSMLENDRGVEAVQCIPSRPIAEQGASQGVWNCAFHPCSPVVILSELALESRSPIRVLVLARVSCSLHDAGTQISQVPSAAAVP